MLRMRGPWVLAALFVLSLPAVTPRIYASDEIEYFAFLRSLWFDHDLSFDNEYRYFDDRGIAARAGFHATFLEETTPTGHRKTYATIGAAILWAPFYAAGDLTARTMHALGRPVAVDGYSKPYIAAICYGSAVYGFLALLLSASIARRLGVPSTAAVIAVWIGTPVLFYMYLAPVFAHACGAFAVALFLWTWLRVRETWTPGGVAVLGLIAALAVMVREQDVVFALGPAIDYVRWAAGRGRTVPFSRKALTVASGLIAFAVAYLPQVAAYVVINGGLKPAGDVSRKMTWTSPHAGDVLLSPEHGLVFWTPLVLLAAAGLLWLWRDHSNDARAATGDRRWIAGCLILAVLGTIYMAGSVESWTVAGAFGQRRFMSLTPLVVVGLSALWPIRATVARTAFALLVAVCVWWNLGLMIQFSVRSMDRQRLTLAANARRTFVDLPWAAPRLAWRYLTDRSSFYDQPPQ